MNIETDYELLSCIVGAENIEIDSNSCTLSVKVSTDDNEHPIALLEFAYEPQFHLKSCKIGDEVLETDVVELANNTISASENIDLFTLVDVLTAKIKEKNPKYRIYDYYRKTAVQEDLVTKKVLESANEVDDKNANEETDYENLAFRSDKDYNRDEETEKLLNGSIFDSHCHLIDEFYTYDEKINCLKRFINKSGIGLVIISFNSENANSNLEFIKKVNADPLNVIYTEDEIKAMDENTKKFVEKFKLFTTVGLHPRKVDDKWQDEIDSIKLFLKRNSSSIGNEIIAIGEVGIDLKYIEEGQYNYEKEQIRVLTNAFELGLKYNLPVIIHAHKSCDLEIVEKILDKRTFASSQSDAEKLKFILHGFGTAPVWAERMCFYYTAAKLRSNYDEVIASLSKTKEGKYKLKKMLFSESHKVNQLPRNIMIAAGGVSTYSFGNFKKSINRVNLSRVLVETDAPFTLPFNRLSNDEDFNDSNELCKSNEEDIEESDNNNNDDVVKVEFNEELLSIPKDSTIHKKKSEPAFVSDVINNLSQKSGILPPVVKKITRENAFHMFNIWHMYYDKKK